MSANDNQQFVGSTLKLPDAQTPVVRIQSPDDCQALPVLSNVAVLPGSFNPVHHGHRQLKRIAERLLQRPVVYELSIRNADKPELTQKQIRFRLQQLLPETVVLTQAALFTDKARLFPGCPFVVGFDTARRILDPRFYADDCDRMLAMLRFLAEQGHRFLVAGRLQEQSSAAHFGTLRDLTIPPELDGMFAEIPEQLFREDVSSTQLRQRQSTAPE